ncbi:MFS transporter [Ekhidna sp.]|uniref:MFS transporter n=1 Tax=Ekhidna sp. TaxID=2608089 RepID=UPI003CCC00B3
MQKSKANWIYLVLLILSGEAIFVLPFVLQRVFRSTVLEVFEISNTQLGLCFTFYGITAMLSYFVGGPIADRFEPRKLIAWSLWTTALGGFIYALYPGFYMLQLLYGYWGFTTILLFWSPMIKATRIWGGASDQGKAFGILDGGRGLVGALFGVFAVALFANSLLENVDINLEERREAFKWAIYGSTVSIAVIGILVWLFLKSEEAPSEKVDHLSVKQVKEVIKLPAVWLLMVIILCAYMGYKTTDVVSLYAREVLHYDEINSAHIGTFLLFMRPLAGVLIGFAADRSKTTLWLFISFAIMFVGSLWFVSGFGFELLPVFLVSIFTISGGVYAARALYFAVMREGRIPLYLTGTAVGVVSVVGFTPDVFAGVIIGFLLDTNPGELGHQHVFLLLAAFSALGTFCAWRYHKLAPSDEACKKADNLAK